jgi:hypothetical protein
VDGSKIMFISKVRNLRTIALKCSFFYITGTECILMPNEWHDHIYAPYKKNELNDYKK